MIIYMNINVYNDCTGNLGLCKSTTREKFWLDDPTELYKNGKYTQFMPQYAMTRNQQLNSVTRLGIYMVILILMFYNNTNLLFIPITIILIAALLKKFNTLDDRGQEKELDKVLTIRQDIKHQEDEEKTREYRQDDDNHLKTYSELDQEERREGKEIYGGIRNI